MDWTKYAIVTMLILFVGLTGVAMVGLVKHEQKRSELYQHCLMDKVPEYECYGKLYRGSR